MNLLEAMMNNFVGFQITAVLIVLGCGTLYRSLFRGDAVEPSYLKVGVALLVIGMLVFWKVFGKSFKSNDKDSK